MATNFIDLLLVDDDAVDRELIRRLLPSTYSIREASLGLAALSLVKGRQPDCILLEWRLPDIDGVHLLQHFSKAQIPVVVTTRVRNPQYIEQAMQHGAQDFLLKGELSTTILQQTIADAIEDVAMMQGKAAVPSRLQYKQMA